MLDIIIYLEFILHVCITYFSKSAGKTSQLIICKKLTSKIICFPKMQTQLKYSFISLVAPSLTEELFVYRVDANVTRASNEGV